MAIDPVSLAITAALMAASMAMTMSQKIKGTRLDDMDVSLSEYGTPIPRFWGVRRLQPQIMWAETLREKKTTNKTKGGKFQDYKYYGTWAVLICDHEIDSVSRIWFDKHLVYQATGPGPISPSPGLAGGFSGSPFKLSTGRNMRVYLGTESQDPDPRMEAWCEDRYGADSCPAYRGSSYIVFEELPLEKFGNRIPQITVEVISSKTDAFPYESKVRASDITELQFSPDFSRMVVPIGGLGLLEVWDTANRTKMFTSTMPTGIRDGIGVRTGGDFYAIHGFPAQELWLINPTGGGTLVTADFDAFADSCAYVGNRLLIYPYQLVSPQVLYLSALTVVYKDPGFIPTHFFEDIGGNAMGVGQYEAGGNFMLFADMPDGIGSPVATTSAGDAYAMDNGVGSYVAYQNGKLHLIDKLTLTLTTTINVTVGGLASVIFRNIKPGASSIWLGDKEYSTADLSLIQTVDYSDWSAEDVDISVYDPINHAILCQPQVIMNYTWRYLNRVGSDGVQLGDVVDDVSGWCGLTGQDTSALTQTVLGYSGTQGAGKDWIAPLLDMHDVDPRPHDFAVQFVNRGSSPVGTILTGDFVREGEEARYTVTIQQDTDLPKKLTYNFADEGKDQQTNTVISQRPLDATDSSREESIDLTTYVDTPAGVQQKADRHFRRLWNSRERIANSLTAQLLALEPGDVKTLSLDGVLRNARLDKLTISGSALNCEFVRDESNIAVLNGAAGAEMEGRDPEVIYIPSLTQGFVLDIPLVVDADNDVNPVIYYAAGPYSSPWPGAGFYRGEDGTYDDISAFVESSAGATWGFTNDALSTANPNLWDRGNTVNVGVPVGTLTSTTEAEIDADPTLNLCAMGNNERWEMLQFATATLEGDGTYTLSDLKRGRRGTEWAVGLHEIGDQFVMLDAAIPVELGMDEIGNDMSTKAISVGREESTAFAIDFTYTGASLKPYAPAVQSVTKDAATGDITVDFDRRTRIGGSWNGSVIPLGEATEAYELDVLDGADVARTLTAVTSSFTYTAAQQTTDFGAPIAANDLDAMVYQMSATVGRGFAATI